MAEHLIFAAAAAFEAARHVDILPMGHRSRRLHGHSFLAKVRVSVPNGSARFPGAEVGQLRRLLSDCVAPLDYELLNNRVSPPTDENIARWIRSRLDVSGMENIGVQSTVDEGVDLDGSNQAHVWRRYAFQSAHRLPNVPAGHKCGRMHGHGFEVIIHANQAIGSREISIDYDHIDKLWAPIFAELNCACLNDIKGLENPTSELISSWIWNRLRPRLPELTWVTVYETATCGAHFDGKRYRIWKEMSMDCAVRFSRAPIGDPRRRIHGHTYILRLHLDAPLDKLLGWTIDFGDVKEVFTPVFKKLDHQPLYELPGAEDNDVAALLRWIRAECHERLPALDRIDLYETRGCGAILSWGNEPPALPV
ncbi:MAG: 6-pyruvoyl tetrahydropterin synthase [Betaproteobacteria bacterium]|nr:MAG: 6-pyruvoyl tetrahydropterin synthase [Betaproteobacteria bacterium]